MKLRTNKKANNLEKILMSRSLAVLIFWSLLMWVVKKGEGEGVGGVDLTFTRIHIKKISNELTRII